MVLAVIDDLMRQSRVSAAAKLELHEFIIALKWRSDRLHVFPVFTTATGKIAPAVVLASPRVSSPADAKASGKAVICLQGNIHPPAPEGTVALLMVMRDILFGSRQHLLDNQILVIQPIFNMDGTDMVSSQDGTPHITGSRANARGFDLNRDAVKLETPEANGLYQNILNPWDPLLFVDLHLMGRVKHGYANTYATSTVPAAHPGPRTYMWETLFPAVRESVRRDFGLETFTRALADDAWPPAVWSHDNAIRLGGPVLRVVGQERPQARDPVGLSRGRLRGALPSPYACEAAGWTRGVPARFPARPNAFTRPLA